MRNIRQLLEVKGHEVWSIGPHESVLSAIERMAQKGIGALLVMQDGQTMGVISERDYARKVILQGKSSMRSQTRRSRSVWL